MTSPARAQRRLGAAGFVQLPQELEELGAVGFRPTPAPRAGRIVLAPRPFPLVHAFRDRVRPAIGVQHSAIHDVVQGAQMQDGGVALFRVIKPVVRSG
jgi:hypothetical protein